MVKRKRRELAAEAARLNREQLARMGGDLCRSRKRRRMTQQRLGDLVDVSRSAVSAIECGRGGGHTLDTWQRLGVAVDRPLRIQFERDPKEEPADAGHLAIQELVLRTAKAVGIRGTVELATRPSNPGLSADLALRMEPHRRIALVECWNTFGDIGAAVRSTDRKRADLHSHDLAVRGETAYEVTGCWVVRASRRNRALIGRYPELFAARFPGSSYGWVRALMEGTAPPDETGLIWCDVPATRLFAWRRQ
jgi:transcriptional regulator with XRE-family HTH domain